MAWCLVKHRDNFIFLSRCGGIFSRNTDDRGFESRKGPRILLFTTVSRPALGHTQPLIQWVPGASSVGAQRSGREDDHSPPSSAEVKNAWSYTSHPQYVFMARCSEKAQGQFYPYNLPLRQKVIFVPVTAINEKKDEIKHHIHSYTIN
jgi:hypothetical protein